ncbi:putative mannose-resistant/Proteus-like fimbrial protein [Yersinia intermedia]|jgi:type 1 fimbria pilin|uniref:fimbrial protein n=1 Tax=Yersinia intermedia TaxID=631 RepID=UPI0005E35FEF|nr:fimbrial protein [Yersinia intermedia]MCB5322821.1 type 1 fimbrial protein [Yersinia intermedia]UZM72354.1 type 1 fimbrial protein [Yersinia intermedia]CNC53578.1 putative mannose-resistant/Proteus-like fimbrial protein [Yersinia intermedia]CNG59200.1 putative mannose-resistant/Proteus-like fimbrial protein [Yersinia intermedia]
MKLNKIVLGVSLAFGIVSFVQAATDPTADLGHGTVTFTGSIVDAPCSIDPESIDQTVDLGQVSNVALDNKGTSTPKSFTIKLEKCNIGDKGKSVTAKFTGAEGSTAGLLGITGSAKGASIAVIDGKGTLIELGKSTEAQKLQNGNNTLLFSAYLQGDGASGGVVPGDFKSVANFTLDYQ